MENLITLGILIMLQAVLGIDNLLYIALESKNVPENKQRFVRNIGIGAAVVLRIVLLIVLVSILEFIKNPIFHIDFPGIIEGSFSIHILIVLIGGGFIIYTAVKEIWSMISMEDHSNMEVKKFSSVGKAIFMISIMNVVFSFDSILSTIALTKVFWVMLVSTIAGGALMMFVSGAVSSFLQKNRAYEVLGMFILFLVGIMLLTEAGHNAHLTIFGNGITPMNQTTFYFVLIVLIIVDILQTRYKKKLLKIKEKNENKL